MQRMAHATPLADALALDYHFLVHLAAVIRLALDDVHYCIALLDVTTAVHTESEIPVGSHFFTSP
jgi:hypothetical protein